MIKLSIIIICKNEEAVIEDAIKSSLFANEVIVLDSGSTDNTCQIAKNLGVEVLHQDWLGFGRQKQKAVELASNKWVFILDSDERITQNLQIEILDILNNPQYKGYFVPRLNNFWGNDIKSCGLYPDFSLRLFNRDFGIFNDVPVHESVQMTTKVGYLNNHMIHLAYSSIEEFIIKQNCYSTLHHKKKNILKAIFSPYWTFFKLFIIKRGFLDGINGFVISKLYAQYTFWKYIK